MIRKDAVQGVRKKGRKKGEEGCLRRALVARSRPDAEGNPCGANLYPGNQREKRVAIFFFLSFRRDVVTLFFFPFFVRMLQVG